MERGNLRSRGQSEADSRQCLSFSWLCGCWALLAACGAVNSSGSRELPAVEQEALSVCEGGPTVYGIDISNNEGSGFDLSAAKANGVRFVYLKASQGDYFTDWTYAGYRNRAKAIGLMHGAYHFFDPASDPNAAADRFLSIIGSAPKGDLPPALDWEITSGIDWGTAFARAKIFLDRVEQATGRVPMIYTYPFFFGAQLPGSFAKYPLWISNPGNACPLMPPDGPWNHFSIFQYDTSSCPGWASGCSGGLDQDHFIGTYADLQAFAGGTVVPPIPSSAHPLDQIENNGAISAANWADGHVEVFARTNSGRALHVWTHDTSDNWTHAYDLGGSAECGVSAVVSYAGGQHAELFDSSAHAGDTESDHSKRDGAWANLSSFGGRNLVQLSALRWSDDPSGGWEDGRTEVFGLAAGSRHIYHKYYDPFSKKWSNWDAMGGDFATGVAPILNKQGDAVLFATDVDGDAEFNESTKASGGGWKGWRTFGHAKAIGGLSSRPVAVRESNGTLRIFARGQDGKLYGSYSTSGGFSPFEVIDDTFILAGEPSAAIDDGMVKVFVRGGDGHVYRVGLDEKTHKFGRFLKTTDDVFKSDPFAWQRPDGHVEIFAIDQKGDLRASYHGKNGWDSFKKLAGNVDDCLAPLLEPACPNGNGTYCGGHGVSGSGGTLYSCADGQLTKDQTCPSGCTESGKGGQDSCQTAISCTSTTDCAEGQLCSMPATFCDESTGPGTCTSSSKEGQTCAQASDCGSSMTCAPCQGCGNGYTGLCCQPG